MKKILLSFLLVFALCVFGPSANAAIIFNDWQIDLNPVGINKVYSNISEIFYHGCGWGTTADIDGNGQDAGDFGRTHGVVQSLTYQTTGGLTAFFGPDVEFTFDFSVNTYTWAVIGPNANFTHLAAGTVLPAPASHLQVDGLLDIYVDPAINGNTLTGAGMSDGIHIATFAVLDGGGGVWTPTTYDGSDDATFQHVWSVPGVLLDGLGNPIDNSLTIAITDSNYDADPDGDGAINGWPGSVADPYFGAAAWGAHADWPPANTLLDFTALEDGSATLGAVPEPATLVLLGFGLCGMAAVTRKKFRK